MLLGAAAPGPAQAVGDRQVTAQGYAIAAVGDAPGNRFVCNLGLSPIPTDE